MALVINSNIASLNSQRHLGGSQSSLNTSLERLSSGLRINSAKDDAAGLAISERFTTQIRGLNQAARNANDGVSLAQTAEGALGGVTDMLQRMRELAVQSANATNSASDRAALQTEVTQLTDEINRVARTTSFNGVNLLDGSFNAQAFQVGANAGETVSIASIANAQTNVLGLFNGARPSGVAADGGYVAPTPATPTASTVSGAYTQAASTVSTDAFQVTIDGVTVSDRLVGDASAVNLQTDIAAFVAGSGGAYTLSGTVGGGDLVISKVDGTNLVIATSFSDAVDSTNGAAGTTSDGTFGGGFVATHTGANDGDAGTPANFTALTGTDFTINGTNIEVGTAVDAATRGADLAAAINNAGIGVTARADAAGALTLSSAEDIVIAGGGAVLEQTGLTAGTTTAAIQAGTAVGDIDISEANGAQTAIDIVDRALTEINSSRADLGALQNRFEAVVSNIGITAENLTAARSRIKDADFAAETAAMTRAQILQQAGVAMVSQANSLPQLALSLLQ